MPSANVRIKRADVYDYSDYSCVSAPVAFGGVGCGKDENPDMEAIETNGVKEIGARGPCQRNKGSGKQKRPADKSNGKGRSCCCR